MRNRERGKKNGGRGTGNGERGMGNGEWEIEKWEIVVNGNTTHQLDTEACKSHPSC